MEAYVKKPFPKTRDEARRWNYYNKGDKFFPIRDWPHAMQRYGMSGNLNNQGRLNLWTFFVGNGMRPKEASQNVLLNSHLSSDSERDMKNFEKMFKEGKLRGKYHYYDVYDKTYSKFY